MILSELFNNYKALKFTKNEPNEFVAAAMLGGRKFTFKATLSDSRTDSWDTEFHDENRSTFMTGKGNSNEIMACAYRFIEMLIKQKKPKAIEFSSVLGKKKQGSEWVSHHSRADLYKRMFERDSFGYKFSWKDYDNHRLFTLTRPA